MLVRLTSVFVRPCVRILFIRHGFAVCCPRSRVVDGRRWLLSFEAVVLMLKSVSEIIPERVRWQHRWPWALHRKSSTLALDRPSYPNRWVEVLLQTCVFVVFMLLLTAALGTFPRTHWVTFHQELGCSNVRCFVIQSQRNYAYYTTILSICCRGMMCIISCDSTIRLFRLSDVIVNLLNRTTKLSMSYKNFNKTLPGARSSPGPAVARWMADRQALRSIPARFRERAFIHSCHSHSHGF